MMVAESAGGAFIEGSKAQRDIPPTNMWVTGVYPPFALSLHCLEELRVGLRVLHLLEQEFDGR